MSVITRICVYCGSSPGRSESYAASAVSLAEALVSRGITLVYAGAGIGLMGIVADEVIKRGGQVIGVIPKALAHKEVAHPNLTELQITDSMHERKMRMAELADGFIALPGGIGTLEELFEIWTWAQLGLHNKPCGLLNVNGYYNALIAFLNHIKAEQFLKNSHHDLLMVEAEPNLLLDRFADYQPPVTAKWLTRDET